MDLLLVLMCIGLGFSLVSLVSLSLLLYNVKRIRAANKRQMAAFQEYIKRGG